MHAKRQLAKAKKNSLLVNGTTLNEGDWITLNGSSGKVYSGKIPLKDVNLQENPYFENFIYRCIAE